MSELFFPFDKPPEPGQRQCVLPGLDWVRQPLPFALDHVNCWILDGDDRVLIDTALATDSNRALWELHFQDKWPDRLLVTHFHPDHAGLASWFAGKNATVYGHDIEMRLAAEIWSVDDESYGPNISQWYERHGVDRQHVERVRAAGNTYRRIVAPPVERWHRLEAGQQLSLAGRQFEVIVGQGHSPAMLMLYQPEAHLLIAADQVLPGISPNVSVMWAQQDGDPLGDFLKSLDALRRLPENTFVLPSHGLPFHGLHQRLDALALHHEERLEKVLNACRTPQSAAALFSVLYRRELDAQQMSFALGESLAHIRYLETRGKLRQIEVDGVFQYVCIDLV